MTNNIKHPIPLCLNKKLHTISVMVYSTITIVVKHVYIVAKNNILTMFVAIVFPDAALDS